MTRVLSICLSISTYIRLLQPTVYSFLTEYDDKNECRYARYAVKFKGVLYSQSVYIDSSLILRLEVTSVQFTVGKLDAGMAILLSPDHHLIEFPATILPVCTTASLSSVAWST